MRKYNVPRHAPPFRLHSRAIQGDLSIQRSCRFRFRSRLSRLEPAELRCVSPSVANMLGIQGQLSIPRSCRFRSQSRLCQLLRLRCVSPHPSRDIRRCLGARDIGWRCIAPREVRSRSILHQLGSPRDGLCKLETEASPMLRSMWRLSPV